MFPYYCEHEVGGKIIHSDSFQYEIKICVWSRSEGSMVMAPLRLYQFSLEKELYIKIKENIHIKNLRFFSLRNNRLILKMIFYNIRLILWLISSPSILLNHQPTFLVKCIYKKNGRGYCFGNNCSKILGYIYSYRV